MSAVSSKTRAASELWQELSGEFARRTKAAYRSGGSWASGLRAMGWEICRFLQEDPERARTLVALTYDEEIIGASRDHLMSDYVELVDRGRLERPAAGPVPHEVAEALVGAVWEAIAKRALAGRFEELPYGVPQLMYLTVLPYLGSEAAAAELERGPSDLRRYFLAAA
jgi:hypothetical protein